MLILVASMCAIALSAISTTDWLVTLVLAMFVAGILAMLSSVVWIAMEVRTSQQAVAYEVHSVLQLGAPSERVTPTHPAETVYP
jgi:hypothetical protein